MAGAISLYFSPIVTAPVKSMCLVNACGEKVLQELLGSVIQCLQTLLLVHIIRPVGHMFNKMNYQATDLTVSGC